MPPFFCLSWRRLSQCMAMTKSELVDRLAARVASLNIQHRDVELSVKLVLDEISRALAADNRVEIRGFGSFALNHRPARVGRNPKTGETVDIPAKRVPHFKPGKALREAVDARRAAQS